LRESDAASHFDHQFQSDVRFFSSAFLPAAQNNNLHNSDFLLPDFNKVLKDEFFEPGFAKDPTKTFLTHTKIVMA